MRALRDESLMLVDSLPDRDTERQSRPKREGALSIARAMDILDEHGKDPPVLHHHQLDDDILRTSRIGSCGTCGFTTCCISLLKTILGTGMLALPFAVASLGLVLGGLLLVLCGCFAVIGLRTYSLCGMRVGGDASLGVICKMADRRLERLVDTAILCMCLGSLVSYFVLIGDMLPSLFFSLTGWDTDRRVWILAAGLFVVGPLTLVKNFKSLRYVSLLALGGIVYTFLLALTQCFTQSWNEPSVPLVAFSKSSISNLTVIVFAFTCHQNLLAIKAEARDKSERFTMRVVHVSVAVSLIVYLFFSLVSCLVFGATVHPNILQDFPAEGRRFWIARLLNVLMAVGSYPLMAHPAKRAIITMIPYRPSDTASTAITLAIAILGGLFITNLGTISSIIGVLAGIPICHLLPFYLHYRLFPEDRPQGKSWSVHLKATFVMFVFGLALAVVTIYTAVLK